MQLGYVGLGKMGSNMVARLLEKKHSVIVSDVNPAAVKKLVKKGANGSSSMDDMVTSLKGQRLVWVMVPSQFTSAVIKDLLKLLRRGDTIIDGGNTPFKLSIKHHTMCKRKGVNFLDVGVSGGPKGARNGACMMIGGDKKIFKKYEKLFKDLNVASGYAYMGKAGSGHFVKMIHNGIEYGMMQAMAEGFDIIRSNKSFNVDLEETARVYNHGSVIESRLMGWMHSAFKKYGDQLKGVTNKAGGLGEGKWTSDYAHEKGIKDKVIHESVRARLFSKKKPNFQAQIIMALRNQFGGHSIKGNKKDIL